MTDNKKEHHQHSEEELLQLYRRIASGEIDPDVAAREIGFANFHYLDNYRCSQCPKVPSLTHLGFRRGRHSNISRDALEQVYYEIATQMHEGKDTREEKARELGFKNFDQMDRRRTDLNIMSIRNIGYDLFPDLEQAHRKRRNDEHYREHLRKMKEKYRLKTKYKG